MGKKGRPECHLHDTRSKRQTLRIKNKNNFYKIMLAFLKKSGIIFDNIKISKFFSGNNPFVKSGT